MDFIKTTPRPTTRLKRGNVLLANAQGIDTSSVRARLETFVDIHRRFIEANARVQEAEGLELLEQERVQQLDGVQAKALAALSATLQLDGEARRNPFGRFIDPTPGEIARMSFADRARTLRHLAATLQRSLGPSKATLAAAAEVAEAAVRVEEALPGLELRRSFLDMARQRRDSLIPQWNAAYFALRHLTRSLIEEPHLYATLFAAPRISTRKAAADDSSSPSEQPGEASPPAGNKPQTAPSLARESNPLEA